MGAGAWQDMLSASLCSLQSHPFPKFALEPVLCSYCFNSVVLINMVVLFALLKGRERERCLFFFSLPCSPTDGSFDVFSKVEYPRKVNRVGTPKRVKNVHLPSLTFMLLSEVQGFILPWVLAWITPWYCCFFPFSVFPYHIAFPGGHSELTHPASLPAETVSSGGFASRPGAFCRSTVETTVLLLSSSFPGSMASALAFLVLKSRWNPVIDRASCSTVTFCSPLVWFCSHLCVIKCPAAAVISIKKISTVREWIQL